MGFGSIEDGRKAPPPLLLEQTGRKWFTLRDGFQYTVPAKVRYPYRDRNIEVPSEFRTDLASVPWLFWWLVASYGGHTRAVILHDALVGDGKVVPVDGATADHILLVAMEDVERKTAVGAERARRGSFMRHHLAWAAVCLFGTMRFAGIKGWALIGLFVTMVAAFWTSVVGPMFFGWEPWVREHGYFGWHPPEFVARWAPAAVLGFGGFLWKFNPYAAHKIAGRLWPIGLIGLPLLVPALVVLGITTILIWLADVVVWFIRGLKSKPGKTARDGNGDGNGGGSNGRGGGNGWGPLPPITSYRDRGRSAAIGPLLQPPASHGR